MTKPLPEYPGPEQLPQGVQPFTDDDFEQGNPIVLALEQASASLNHAIDLFRFQRQPWEGPVRNGVFGTVLADLSAIEAWLDVVRRRVPSGRLSEERYYTLWPKACRACRGSGWETRGSGWYNDDYDVDYCSTCAGSCPRCRRRFSEANYETLMENPGACPRCGWYSLDPDATAGAPRNRADQVP